MNQHPNDVGDAGTSRNGLDFQLARLLKSRGTVTLSPDATLDQVVQELHRTRAREIVLVEGGSPVGIFTRSDLVSRVLVPKLGFDTCVRAVMTTELVILNANDRGFDAVIEMHRHGVSRIVLVDDHKHFVGVISDSDLLYALQDSVDLHHLIMEAQTEGELIRAASMIRSLAVGLISEGVRRRKSHPAGFGIERPTDPAHCDACGGTDRSIAGQVLLAGVGERRAAGTNPAYRSGQWIAVRR